MCVAWGAGGGGAGMSGAGGGGSAFFLLELFNLIFSRVL
jgi:hypothetical protein